MDWGPNKGDRCEARPPQRTDPEAGRIRNNGDNFRGGTVGLGPNRNGARARKTVADSKKVSGVPRGEPLGRRSQNEWPPTTFDQTRWIAEERCRVFTAAELTGRDGELRPTPCRAHLLPSKRRGSRLRGSPRPASPKSGQRRGSWTGGAQS